MDGFFSHLLGAITHLNQTQALLVFSLVTIRMLMVVTLVPFLGSKNAPGPVKIGLAVFLAMLLWPLATAQMKAPLAMDFVYYMALLLKEVFVGFSLGFVTAKIFYAVEMAGQIIDVVRGTNQVQLMVPELSERSSPYGDIYYQLALILFLSTGLYGVFFEGLVESFIAVPVDQMVAFSHGQAAFYEEFMFLFAEIFKIAVSLALPIMAVCLVINIAFGLINRIAPQINAYFLSMPAIAVGGMAISLAALSMTIDQFERFSVEIMKHFQKVIQLLG